MARDARAQLQQNVKVSDELKPHFQVTTILVTNDTTKREKLFKNDIQERPYVMFKTIDFDYVNSNDVQFEGFCIDLLQELANDLGWSRILVKRV
jgi:hypothetical protein